MSTRSERLLDAAIEVLGTRGLRQLTHRAVDAAAEVPAGSASNYFRTRQALLEAVVARLIQRDGVDREVLAGAPAPADVAGFAAMLGQTLRAAATTERARTLARYALLLEAGVHAPLREPLVTINGTLLGWGTRWLRELGSREPERHCRLLLEYMDGRLLHQVARPGTDFDPVPDLYLLLERLLRPETI